MQTVQKPLEIQKFLRGEGNLGDLKKAPYKLSISASDDGQRIGFKYNQIKSDLSEPICQEARGLILDREDWDVVSFPMKKVFNAAEDEAVDIDWASAVAYEKMDGTCVHGDAEIITEDGVKTIREICEEQYDGKVLSYDAENDEVCWDSVVGWFVRPETNEWYELETESGETVKLTGDHRVYLPELECYRRVDDLEGDEVVLLNDRLPQIKQTLYQK